MSLPTNGASTSRPAITNDPPSKNTKPKTMETKAVVTIVLWNRYYIMMLSQTFSNTARSFLHTATKAGTASPRRGSLLNRSPTARGATGRFPHITATAPQGKLSLYARGCSGTVQTILVPLSSIGVPSRRPRSANVVTCAWAITSLERGVRVERVLRFSCAGIGQRD